VKRDLIIVGNAQPHPTQSAASIVDEAGMVIRFNRIPFFHTGLTGSKTTVHVLQNMDFHQGDAPLRPDREQTWIISENPDKDYGAKVAAANNVQGWTRIYSDLLDVPFKLQAKGGSSGFITIEYLLANRYHHWFNICLLNFTWQGWEGHAWATEKQICEHYHDHGLLTIL